MSKKKYKRPPQKQPVPEISHKEPNQTNIDEPNTQTGALNKLASFITTVLKTQWVGVISSVFLIYNTCNNNAKWNAVNSGYIRVEDMLMNKFREIPLAEIYDNSLYNYHFRYSHSLDGQKAILGFELEAYDLNDKKIKISKPSHIPAQLRQEVERVGFTDSFNIWKSYYPRISLANKGQTAAIIKSVKIGVKHSGVSMDFWQTAVDDPYEMRLEKDKNIVPFINFRVPLEAKIADTLFFKILVGYEDIDEKVKVGEFYVAWVEERDEWLYTEQMKAKAGSQPFKNKLDIIHELGRK